MPHAPCLLLHANYEYGPFGEPLRLTGPTAQENPFRFSTKRTDNTTDLVLYEYRACSPTLGRWLSRDPMDELGFRWLGPQRPAHRELQPLYCYVGNEAVGRWDWLGLADSPTASFWAALAAQDWELAWTILETVATESTLAALRVAYARAVAAAVALEMSPALRQFTRAAHIVQPKHLWCRLVQLLPHTRQTITANFARVRPFIERAWKEGTIVAVRVEPQLLVTKEAVINGERIQVVGRVLPNGSGVVEIVDAWVMPPPPAP